MVIGAGKPSKGTFGPDVAGATPTKKRVMAVMKATLHPMFLADIVIACNKGYPPSEHIQPKSADMVLNRAVKKGMMAYQEFNVQKGIYVGPVRAYWLKEEHMTRKPIPPFPDEAAEDAFWQQSDSTDVVDWGRAVQAVFPDLKPSTQSISLRLPKPLLHRLKMMANQRDVPYQSLIKTLLFDAVQREDRS